MVVELVVVDVRRLRRWRWMVWIGLWRWPVVAVDAGVGRVQLTIERLERAVVIVVLRLLQRIGCVVVH